MGVEVQFIAEVASAASEDEALARILRHFAADSGTIHLLGPDGVLHLRAASAGIPPVVIATVRRVPVGKGMAGLAVERRQPVDACNIQTDQSGDVRPGAKATNLGGALVVPIFHGDEVVGALGIANRTERAFSEAEVAELMQAGRKIAERK